MNDKGCAEVLVLICVVCFTVALAYMTYSIVTWEIVVYRSGVIEDLVEYENSRDVTRIVFENKSVSVLVFSEGLTGFGLEVGDDVVLGLKRCEGGFYSVKEVWFSKGG